jgi:isopentenyldiphosphate isomerase
MTKIEYLDIFDDNMKHLGKAPREEVHAKGCWHQTFHCWLVRRDHNDKYVLFQRRGPNKTVYPNMLDITAAGHLTAGEVPEDGIRELTEELGVPVTFSKLISLGIRTEVTLLASIVNREFCHTYLLESNISLDEYRLQEDEVSGIVQMRIEDGLRLFAGDTKTAPVQGYQVDEAGHREVVEMPVSVGDIIPRLDKYYLKVFIMADRFFKGERYLGI